LVKRIAEETLTSIRADKELQSGNYAKVKELIESKLVPHFDTARMTALAVGRNWRTASPEQQKELSEQFKTLLIRTYSNAKRSASCAPQPARSSARCRSAAPA